MLHKVDYFTTSANFAPALNFATFFAAILIAAPVAGLTPLRASRFATEKVPKPTIVTLSPFAKAPVTAASNASRAFLE